MESMNAQVRQEIGNHMVHCTRPDATTGGLIYVCSVLVGGRQVWFVTYDEACSETEVITRAEARRMFES